ncbi:DUF4145 domain-containing protein [Uliginosibacterium sp. 31-16]|uniref:DUF4145 domain-containing protein n=1 Tax=Uliginosibacterium sp. 31-16 TaxID=3068315 RepID=UPI00273D3553|nr:DUF4145 domain-containing protein [Uliginosibacterium sp. 31-16]MDP5239610.1 DUF4145 domain-containing protein [Uliginosibacterium sp. 31-16]
MENSLAHCNKCGGDRNHKILHRESLDWGSDEAGIWGADRYETLKCLGCSEIKLRHTAECSDFPDESNVTYFPPATVRPEPTWLPDIWEKLPRTNTFVEPLLKEIYLALRNDQRRLAAMGIRALIETMMISETGDQGTFAQNLNAFVTKGLISSVQRERVETTLEAGHAAIHRGFRPSKDDIYCLMDIAEHLVETVYLHGEKLKVLAQKIPPKNARKAKQSGS